MLQLKTHRNTLINSAGIKSQVDNLQVVLEIITHIRYLKHKIIPEII